MFPIGKHKTCSPPLKQDGRTASIIALPVTRQISFKINIRHLYPG
jgi:hypothetical protein